MGSFPSPVSPHQSTPAEKYPVLNLAILLISFLVIGLLDYQIEEEVVRGGQQLLVKRLFLLTLPVILSKMMRVDYI